MEVKRYYAKIKKQGLTLNMKDASGNIIYEKDQHGNVVMQRGKMVPVQINKEFTTLSGNFKMGFLSVYETTDPNEIEYIEELRKKPGSIIMTEDEYKKQANPEAYKIEQEKAKVAETFKAELKTKDSTIETLQKQLQDLQRRQGKN